MLTQTGELRTPLHASDHADWLGMFCSCLCSAHCLLMPVVISAVPALAESAEIGSMVTGFEFIDEVAAIAGCLLVLGSIVPGYKVHRSRAVAGLAIVGLMTSLTSAFLLPDRCCNAAIALHGESCVCQDYCHVAPGMCVSESQPGSVLLRPLMLSRQESPGPPAALSMVSTAGGFLLILAHLLNLHGRRSGGRCCQRAALERPGFS